MGTRNLTIIVSENEYKLAKYCQWDGYPDGQGVIALEAIRNADLEVLKEKVRKVRTMTEEDMAEAYAKAGVENDGSGWITFDDSKKLNQVNPLMFRNMGAEIITAIYESEADELPVYNDLMFAASGLFCEWAYVIDLDRETFEVYKGLGKKRLSTSDRFHFLYGVAETLNEGIEDERDKWKFDEFHPVKLAAFWKLNDLPSSHDFIETLDGDDEAEERPITGASMADALKEWLKIECGFQSSYKILGLPEPEANNLPDPAEDIEGVVEAVSTAVDLIDNLLALAGEINHNNPRLGDGAADG